MRYAGSNTVNVSIEDFVVYIRQDWNLGMHKACRAGRLDLVNLMIERGATNWDWCMRVACKYGHPDLANLMIEKGADDWNWGLACACEGGHPDLVKLMLSKGANDWDAGMFNACLGGHLDMVNLMISKGANNWDEGMFNACLGGHLDMVNFMISKGANNWSYSMYACVGLLNNPRTIKCAKLMISKGAGAYECLHNAEDAFLYKLYCQHHANHDVVRLHKLIREQDPLYTLMIHNHDELVPVNTLPMDLLRYCKSFLG